MKPPAYRSGRTGPGVLVRGAGHDERQLETAHGWPSARLPKLAAVSPVWSDGEGRPVAGTVQGLGASAAATVAWGLSGIFVVLTTQPALVAALERLWLGVPLVAVLLIASGRRLYWPVVWRALPGGVLLCGDIALFFSAVKLTSIADATIIGALQPVLTLFIAKPLFNERVRIVDVGWTALAIAGMAVVILGSTGPTARHGAIGDLLAAGSVCCWTAYWLFSKRARSSPPRGASGAESTAEGVGSIEYTAGVMLVAAVVMVPVTLLSREHLTAGTPEDWLWLSLLALLPGGAHLLSNWAHRFVDISVSSVIVSINPVIAAGAAAVILHQALDAWQTMGGLVAIVGVVMVARRAARVERPAEAMAA
jgi:drug/metabolite transporter (DMT)-like permease